MESNIYEDGLSSEYFLSPSLDDLFPEINDLNKIDLDCNEVKLEAKLCQLNSNRKTLVTDTNGTFLFINASRYTSFHGEL